MTDRYLYVLPVPSDAQSETGSRARQRLAAQGLLDSDSGAVESISTKPGEQDLKLMYVGRYAEKLAAEVEELANNSELGAIPYFASGGATPTDGYYTVGEADVGREVPQTASFASVSATFTREGSREDKRRSVETSISQVENSFGNDQQALVGVPSAASDVQWFDPESGQTEAVAVVETRTGEHGDVDVVDALASSFNSPSLVYDIPYDREWQTDCHVFDTKGGAKTDADGVLQWARVFRGSHDFDGMPVVSNRLVRVWLGSGLAVEEYDSATSTWTSVALGTSDWELDDWDITHIGLPRVDVQCRFHNPVAGDSFHLDMSLKRGWERPLWIVPETETPPTPSGLQDLLNPVANGSDYSPQAEQGLVPRAEVRH